MGNPDLGAGIARSYNVGVSRDLPALASKIEVDGFYSSLSKNVTVANFQPGFIAPPFMVAQPVNVGKSEEVGVEVEVKGSKDGLRWGANYAYHDVNDKFDLFAAGNPDIAAPGNGRAPLRLVFDTAAVRPHGLNATLPARFLFRIQIQVPRLEHRLFMT